MKKSYITGKNHDFYSKGKAMFDQIQPITQGIPQIPQEDSSNRQWVGLTEWEREAIAVECGAMSADWLVFMEAVERALKEKNTIQVAAGSQAFHGFPDGPVSTPNAGGKCVTAGETAPSKEIDPNQWAFDNGLEST